MTAVEQVTSIYPLKVCAKLLENEITYRYLNSGGFPPTILAKFVGIVIVLHKIFVLGSEHPV